MAGRVDESGQTMQDAEFIQRLQSGDEAAWVQFTTEWGTRLYKHIRRRLVDDEVVEDVQAEMRVAIVRAIQHWPNDGSFSNWLYQIADRKLADHARRQSNANRF
jgi:DNA-directed RNA polymerase specialized sigma24 family protein